MNYLAHLYLAQATDTSYAGALLGDHVRGRLDGAYGPWIESGIHLHRRVDTFTDSHPIVRGAFERLAPPLRRYAGIIVDVYFDHLLARRWPDLHSELLDRFAESAGATLRAEWPNNAPFAADRLADLPDLLLSYRDPAGVAHALARIDERLSRPSPLPHALPQVQAHHDALSADFDRFFPQLVAFAQESGNADATAGAVAGNETR